MADRTFSKPEATLSTDALSASSFIQLARVMARTSVARKASTADDQRCHQVCIVASSGRAGLGGSIVHRDATQAPSEPYCSPCRRLVGVHTGQLVEVATYGQAIAPGSTCWMTTGTDPERSDKTSSRTSARRRWRCCSGW